MKSAILYAMTERPEKALEYTPCGAKDRAGNIRTIWVRVVISTAGFLHALDKAKPRPGEIVLNSVPLP